MSGVLGALIASSGDRYRVTLGNSGGSMFGYGRLLFGSISPKSDIRGNAINFITSATNADFVISLDDIVSQDFFDTVRVENTDGNIVSLNTSDATFTTFGQSTWEWDTTRVWTEATGTKYLEII